MKVLGDAVTPIGRPVIATETEPVKELSAVARAFTCEPAWPPVRVSEVGEMLREKSGGGAIAEMVAATVVEWLRAPEVPVSVRVTLAAAAVEAATSVMFCGKCRGLGRLRLGWR